MRRSPVAVLALAGVALGVATAGSVTAGAAARESADRSGAMAALADREPAARPTASTCHDSALKSLCARTGGGAETNAPEPDDPGAGSGDSGGGGGPVRASTPVPTSARLGGPCDGEATGSYICPPSPDESEEEQDTGEVSTGQLAFQANERLPIPAPAVKTAPPRGKKVLVQLPTWFWLDKSQWDARSATARAGGAWSTVTAQAYELVVDPGDGGDPVTCAAPGTPYAEDADTDDACTYTYPRSGTYTVSVTVRWAADWRGSDGNGGTLPTLTQSSTFPIHVVQARSELIQGP